MRCFDVEVKLGDSGAMSLPACGLLRENKVCCYVWRAAGTCAPATRNRGIPPPPSLCGIITLARNPLQNPDDKELRGQNLDDKDLRGDELLWSRPSRPRP